MHTIASAIVGSLQTSGIPHINFSIFSTIFSSSSLISRTCTKIFYVRSNQKYDCTSRFQSYPENVPNSYYLSEIGRRRSSGRQRKSTIIFSRLNLCHNFLEICASGVLNRRMKKPKNSLDALKQGSKIARIR